MMMERTCKECGKTMPLEMFPKRGSYYLHSCKECTNAKKRLWRKNWFVCVFKKRWKKF